MSILERARRELDASQAALDRIVDGAGVEITIPEPPEWATLTLPAEAYEVPRPPTLDEVLADNEAKSEQAAARFRFDRVTDLVARPAPAWLIKGLFPARGLAVVYGGPGSGKTFFMLDAAGAIVRSHAFYKRRTRGGLVFYIAGEGSLGLRVRAYMQEHGLTDADMDSMRVLESGVNLLDPDADVNDLICSMQDASEGEPVRMIVIDTLARSMPGGNENAAEDMGAVVANAAKLAGAFDCLLVFVHHSGKDETKGSRGHSSLKGAADCEISIARSGDVRTVKVEKLRDGNDGEIVLTYKLKTIDLGQDPDPDAEPGEHINSCVVEQIETRNDGRPVQLRGEIAGAIVTLLDAKGAGVSRRELSQELSRRWGADSIRKTIMRMVKSGHLTEVAGIIGRGPLLQADSGE